MKFIKIIFPALIAIILFIPQANFGQDYTSREIPASLPEESRALVNRLMQDTGGKVRIDVHSKTGKVRYIGGDPLNAIRQPAFMAPSATSEDAARGFLFVYGPLFGLKDQSRELKVMRDRKADRGRSLVRFQQEG